MRMHHQQEKPQKQRDLTGKTRSIAKALLNIINRSFHRRLFNASQSLIACLVTLVLVVAVNAEPPQSPARMAKVDFAKDVFPILRRSCFECHGEKEQEGGLRLDQKADALDSGMIEPGSPNDSELFRRLLLPRGHDEVMPAIGDPLSKKQVAILRRWIAAGAAWPDEMQVASHWSYVAPQRPSLPPGMSEPWVKSPIDQFVLDRLKEEGLTPSPAASPEKLIRRVYLDLIGLPPTPKEVMRFVADPSDERIESIVDELVQRPQFGERWARPWLDLARYADSHGFQRDDLRDNWAYRDWVIQALNDDMPFDQFTIEQIAGDLLPEATESQKIATGFHRCAPTNVEAGALPEETRTEQVIDRVNTTGAVWLGTTLECCQCHDHKYDPFSTKEYYQFLAFYNNTELEADRASNKPSSIKFQGPSMELSDPNPELKAKRSDLKAQLAELEIKKTSRLGLLAKGLEAWAASTALVVADAPKTHTLDVVSFDSQGSTDSFENLDDGSILLVGGDPPDKDVYTLRTLTALKGIQGFRLDVFRDDSLPGGGPGRGDPKRRNFVLTEFSAELCETDPEIIKAGNSGGEKLQFASATASFSQRNWDVAGAFESGVKTGWAISPKFDDSHWATFVLSETLDLQEETELVFKLRQQWGQSRTIGRFRLSAVTGNLVADSVPKNIAVALKKPVDRWSPKDRRALTNYRVGLDATTKQFDKRITDLQNQLKRLVPDTTLVMVELTEPRMSAVFARGDYQQPGETVQPGTPAILHPMPPGDSNRLALAKWLVSPENPLVARVTVNRWWAELFGQGLVTTAEDFGLKGEPPTHPKLLDWLAVEFVENGWSMKQLLKTIVLSATYQQSSSTSDELHELDDRNQLLARGPRLRMDAEMIRDNALAIGGLLDLKQFGPPIYPFQPDGIWKKIGGISYQYKISPGSEQYRRGVYVVHKRGSPYPSFVNFDGTARFACTVKRSRTNTPLQALTLLNDPVYVEAAKSLARRVRAEKKNGTLEEQIDHAFQICTARRPTKTERDALMGLYRQQLKADSQDEPQPSSQSKKDDAWYCVATVLLNMHETFTKD